MKKQFWKSTFITVAVGLMAGIAQADTYTFDDTWKDWPGTSTAHIDQLGTPGVTGLDVTVHNGILEKIEVKVADRQVYDVLFINTSYAGTSDPSWDNWDYLVYDGLVGFSYSANVVGSLPSLNGVYSVNNQDSYTYTTAKDGSGWDVRQGNPNGIISSNLVLQSSFPYTISYNATSDILTYSFANGIKLNGGFFVAYSEWCANDVIGGGAEVPVPEPGTMLLFGTGLAGLAAVSRRRRN